MKIVKYLSFILFISILFSACSNDNDNKDILDPALEIGQNQTIQYLNTNAASVLITVKSNNKFTATSSAPDWCKTKIENKDSENLTISATENPGPNIRSAEIAVQTEGLSPIIIKVYQLGTTPTILISETKVELKDEDYQFPLKVISNTQIHINLPDWIFRISGPGNTTAYTFMVTPLPDSDIDRVEEITFEPADPSIGLNVAKVSVSQKRTSYPNFAVISDIHLGLPKSKEKVGNALKNIMAGHPRLDAIFVVGDLTESSRITEYNDLIQVFGANVRNATSVYYMLGNHDHAWYDGNPETIYLNKLKQPLNQYIKIKGFPFITISARGPYDNTYYTQAEIGFLSASLEDAARNYPGRPIFVFAHVGVYNTVYGTRASDGWGDDTFSSLLSKYPQAILFSGHSHFPIGDPRSIHQGSFTAVNVGNTSYSEIESGYTEGVHPPGNDEVTEGIIVSMKENLDVYLERLDTYRNKEILPGWTVKAPHNGTAFIYANRNGGSAPAFPNNDRPIISNITNTGCTISFPQATDDEVVHHYMIEILDGSGKLYKTITLFSLFYLHSYMPASLQTDISGLNADTRYTVQITAVDSYDNKSAKITSVEFTTKDT